MTVKASLRLLIGRSRLRYVATPVFDGLVATELSLLRRLVPARPNVVPARLKQVTAIVKTFERPALLSRLLESLRFWFPSLSVVVVDDGRASRVPQGERLIRLPYDSGVAAGRQAALDVVETELTWVLDDDFVAYFGTRLHLVLDLLDQFPNLDLIGGRVVDLPFLALRGSPRAAIYPTSARPVTPLGTRLGDAIVCDKVPNFFVARTERLRLVGWDSQLKRVEHADFFTRARGVLTTAFLSRFSCLHAQLPFDQEYMKKRDDHAADHALLRQRYFSDGMK